MGKSMLLFLSRKIFVIITRVLFVHFRQKKRPFFYLSAIIFYFTNSLFCAIIY